MLVSIFILFFLIAKDGGRFSSELNEDIFFAKRLALLLSEKAHCFVFSSKRGQIPSVIGVFIESFRICFHTRDMGVSLV